MNTLQLRLGYDEENGQLRTVQLEGILLPIHSVALSGTRDGRPTVTLVLYDVMIECAQVVAVKEHAEKRLARRTPPFAKSRWAPTDPTTNLAEVLEAIVELVPEDRHRLRARLHGIIDCCEYTPPDSMCVRWSAAMVLLSGEIGTPTEDWEKEVHRIFVGE